MNQLEKAVTPSSRVKKMVKKMLRRRRSVPRKVLDPSVFSMRLGYCASMMVQKKLCDAVFERSIWTTRSDLGVGAGRGTRRHYNQRDEALTEIFLVIFFNFHLKHLKTSSRFCSFFRVLGKL